MKVSLVPLSEKHETPLSKPWKAPTKPPEKRIEVYVIKDALNNIVVNKENVVLLPKNGGHPFQTCKLTGDHIDYFSLGLNAFKSKSEACKAAERTRIQRIKDLSEELEKLSNTSFILPVE